MSCPSECFFKYNRPSNDETVSRGAATDLESITCAGESLRVVEVAEHVKKNKNVNLYGFSTLAELVFFRANAELPTEAEMNDRFICDAHLHFLFLDWPDKRKEQKTERKRQGVNESLCVLPHDGENPKENRAAQKSNVLWWLKNRNELIHIGSGLCSSHRKIMMSSVTISDSVPKPHKMQKSIDDDEWTVPNDFYDDNNNDDKGSEIVQDSGNNREKIRSYFSEISQLISSTSFYCGMEWNQLAKDTQRRKVSLGVRIVEELCKSMTDGNSSELLQSIVTKLSGGMDDSNCAEQVLNVVGERVTNATNRRSRVEAVASIVDIPYFSSYKILLTIPGVTKYLINQARIFARGGLDLDKKYTRVRYIEKALDFFLSFLARSNVLVSLAWITNIATKSDGTKVDLASTIRTQSYAKIIRMYKDELIKQKIPKEESLSTGTCYAILKAIVPKMSMRKTCVDEYACVANEAWRQLTEIVQMAASMGILSASEQTDLIRRLRLAKSFVECELRHHIEISSSVIQHCATYALSDPDTKAYRSECTHIHDQECNDCSQIDRTITLIRSLLSAALTDLSETDQYEVDRWLQLVARCKQDLSAFVAHVIRGVISDTAKMEVQECMVEGECLLTLDWAQKILPTSAEEAQSSFFAKAGISLHIAHAASIILGQRVHHSFLHLLDSCIQDSQSVSAILKDALIRLKKQGIVKVWLRSDNAGCYKSAGLIGDVACLGEDFPTVTAIIYSESQMGKGPSDRTASHCKRRINEATNGLKNCRDAGEIFKVLGGPDPIKGTSAIHCSIEGVSDEKTKTKIQDIASLFNVKFEDGVVTTRKHCGIGDGKKTDKVEPLSSYLSVTSEGGNTSPESFWSTYGKKTSEVLTPTDFPTDQEDAEKDDQLLKHSSVFNCSTPGCVKVFLTLSQLENHELKGNHKIRQQKDTLLDYCIDKYSEHVENEEAARLIMANDSFKNISMAGNDNEPEGYALKVIKRNGIGMKAKSAAKEFFSKHRNMIPPKRACPRTFAQSMISMREPNGKYKFEVSELISEKQAQGLFSRMEKQRTEVSLAKKTAKGSEVSKTITSRSRKRKQTSGGGTTKAKKSNSVVNHEEDEIDDQVEEDEFDEGNIDEEEEEEIQFLKSMVMEDKEDFFLP